MGRGCSRDGRVTSVWLAVSKEFIFGQSSARRASAGGGEPTGPLPGAVGKPRRTPSSFLRRFPLVMGPAGQLVGGLAAARPADAAGHGQAVARVGISAVLAMEVPP